MRASPLGRQRCPLGTTCERLGRLAADDRNRTAKRARVDRRAGRLLVVRSGRLVRLSADDRIEAEAEPQRSTTKLSTKIEAEIASLVEAQDQLEQPRAQNDVAGLRLDAEREVGDRHEQ
jgi:hypothetical protein